MQEENEKGLTESKELLLDREVEEAESQVLFKEGMSSPSMGG